MSEGLDFLHVSSSASIIALMAMHSSCLVKQQRYSDTVPMVFSFSAGIAIARMSEAYIARV